VVPRDRRARRVLLPILRRVLDRHRVVVHSRHAADLLHRHGFDQQVGVVPLALPVVALAPDARAGARDELLAGSTGPLLTLAGVLKSAKGVSEVVSAARDLPDARVVLVGRVADDATSRALAERPANVTLIEQADDAHFCRVLAAADAMLLPRSDSVGETSGPLVMAHALGTPVAMLDTGSAPEYGLPQDLVVPAASSVAELVGQAAVRPWQRTTATIDDAVSGVVNSYRREFVALGWLGDDVGRAVDQPPSPEDTPSLTDDHTA
ncbi:MAG TPA: glycosyltransferase, partial [Acidimicrobiales bacterium]